MRYLLSVLSLFLFSCGEKVEQKQKLVVNDSLEFKIGHVGAVNDTLLNLEEVLNQVNASDTATYAIYIMKSSCSTCIGSALEFVERIAEMNIKIIALIEENTKVSVDYYFSKYCQNIENFTFVENNNSLFKGDAQRYNGLIYIVRHNYITNKFAYLGNN